MALASELANQISGLNLFKLEFLITIYCSLVQLFSLCLLDSLKEIISFLILVSKYSVKRVTGNIAQAMALITVYISTGSRLGAPEFHCQVQINTFMSLSFIHIYSFHLFRPCRKGFQDYL